MRPLTIPRNVTSCSYLHSYDFVLEEVASGTELGQVLTALCCPYRVERQCPTAVCGLCLASANSTVIIHGASSGLHPAEITYDGPSRSATIDPIVSIDSIELFDAGEVVTVTLTDGITSSLGEALDRFVWSFTTQSGYSRLEFAQHYELGSTMGVRDITAVDLGGDGDIDLLAACRLGRCFCLWYIRFQISDI